LVANPPPPSSYLPFSLLITLATRLQRSMSMSSSAVRLLRSRLWVASSSMRIVMSNSSCTVQQCATTTDVVVRRYASRMFGLVYGLLACHVGLSCWLISTRALLLCLWLDRWYGITAVDSSGSTAASIDKPYLRLVIDQSVWSKR
jgi:hypothetical protein